MFLGLLGLGMLVGAMAAGYAFLSGSSLLAAFAVYSLTGTLFVLLTVALVAFRETRQPSHEKTGSRSRAHAA